MTDAEEIKLAALKRKLRRAEHNAKASSNARKDWEHRALTAEAERDALKQDADRYRHLRDAENEGDYSIGEATDFCDGGWERVTWRYGDDLDAAIDTAMKTAS